VATKNVDKIVGSTLSGGLVDYYTSYSWLCFNTDHKMNVVFLTVVDVMKHILRLVNYCKNIITPTQPTFLP